MAATPKNKGFASGLSRMVLSASTDKGEADKDQIVDIITFIESDWGLGWGKEGRGLFPVQKVILKATYGIELDNDPKNRFEITDWKRERSRWFTEAEYLAFLYDEGRCNIREVVPGHERRNMILSIGRRSGKTLISSCIAAYETYKLIKLGNPQRYYGVAQSNTIQLMSVATGKDQASLLYNEVSSHFKGCSFFTRFTANNTMSYAKFQTPYDIDKYGAYSENEKAKASLMVTFKASNAGGIRGSGNIVIIMDEVAHFVEKGGGSAEAVYDAVAPSAAAFTPKDKNGNPVDGPDTQSDARIILISSPLGKQGLFYKLFRMGMENAPGSENMLCIEAPTWEVNPTVSANVFKENYAKDPNVFYTEFGGRFSDRTLGWLGQPEELLDCVDPNLKERSRGSARRPHFVGFDLGLVDDPSAIAIVHIEDDGRIVLDYVGTMKAGEGKYAAQERLELDDVADWIKSLSRKFYIAKGMFDHWGAIPFEQALVKRGLTQLEGEQMTAQKNSEIYQNFKAMLWDKRIGLYDINESDRRKYSAQGEDCPEHLPYIQEILELQAEFKSKYIIKVQAPQIRGKHDDMADAVARAVWLASQHLGKVNHISGSVRKNAGGSSPKAQAARRSAYKRARAGGSHPSRQKPRRRR